MEHIRDAISRAREKQNQSRTTPSRLAPRRAAPQQAAPASAPAARRMGADPEFAPIECDFSGFSKNRIISNEQDPVLNAYRVLRTRLLQKMQAHNWRTVAVVAPNSGAGKTVTAINLSIAIASKTGMRPTLCDLDFYRPSVARYLGLKEFPSVLDFFEGKKELDEVTVRPNLPELNLMPNERVTRRGAEYLTGDRVDLLIDTALNDFGSSIVVFDMPPLLGCDDSLAFLPKVDCVLLIAASGVTRSSELKEAARILAKANVAGTVLNRAPATFMPNQYY